MGLTSSGRTWDDASSPAAVDLARRYEAAWRGGARPDPGDYLPRDPARRPGALLALLRSDLALRHEAGERIRVEDYLARNPDLPPDAVVALLYEEFCQREEAGESLESSEYYARFPELAPALRRVLEIHELVGSGRSAASLGATPAPEVRLPEAGQTIAGFHLVEELGRGAFARVFLAKERQLADRPVALKVARRGSREPQALARLQHTHIVPVHSYRVDPATGLHLLCMPYVGRVTLAQVLADPAAAVARTGAELIGVVDRLAPAAEAGGAGPGRRELGRRPFARAVAWWGARLAEALQHAHDRGILHRDVKPSNVLIAGDGLPLLVDFNLAHGPSADEAADAAIAAPGGTLAYMAPEHLEALISGDADAVDARCDVFALGVVLHEMLASARPFPHPCGAISAEEALRRAVADRRAGADPLRRDHPEVPPALEAVVRRCLEPDPADRYASAAELAADLQAVADDGPLPFAREPQPSRSIRWARRRRRPLAALVGAVATMAIVGAALSDVRVERERRRSEVDRLLRAGRDDSDLGRFAAARAQFEAASKAAEGSPELVDRFHEARILRRKAEETDAIRARARALLAGAEPLRLRLLGISGRPEDAAGELAGALKPFFVLANPDWFRLRDLSLLDEATRGMLFEEVDTLLFLRVRSAVHSRNRSVIRDGLAVCERALAFSRTPGPWRALRAHLTSGLDASAPRSNFDESPSGEASPRACLKWGLFLEQVGRPAAAMAWLERATQLEPGDFWSRFVLSYLDHRDGRVEEALRHGEVAVALRPDSPWARLNRARVLEAVGAWSRALDDLDRAVSSASSLGFDYAAAHLERGVVRMRLGDVPGARASFEAAGAPDRSGPIARAARLDLARLDADAGDPGRARSAYEELIAEGPSNETGRLARLGLARLDLREGRPDRAESELSRLLVELDALRGSPDARGLRADVLARRATARLGLGRPAEAEGDAEAALALSPGPAAERLRDRTLLASGRLHPSRLQRPEEIARWPVGGPALGSDLLAASDRLRPTADGPDPASALAARLGRAVLLSALRDHPAAEVEAGRALAIAPGSARAFLIRARVRLRAGDRRGAMADVGVGLRLEPDASRLLALRGALRLDRGEPEAALDDLDRALALGAEPAALADRARCLMAMGRDEAAISSWSSALSCEPEDPRAALGRARALARLGRPDAALADLEHAASWTDDDPILRARIALAYASILPERPDRLPRVLVLARDAFTSPVDPLAAPTPAWPRAHRLAGYRWEAAALMLGMSRATGREPPPGVVHAGVRP